MTCDVTSVAAKAGVSLVIEAVSVQKDFRTNLNQSKFDDYLATTGPDYVIKLSETGRIQRLAAMIRGVALGPGGDPERMDLRSRVDLRVGDALLKRVYIDAFGGILCDGKRLTPAAEGDWLRAALDEIGSDFVVTPRVRSKP